MKNSNKNNRSQFLKYISGILFIYFGFIFISTAQTVPNQISSIEEKVFTDRTEALVKGYFDNLTTIGKLDEEKDIFIGEFVNSTFENNKVRVYNDIDPTGSTQTDFDILTYLDNISLFFSSSEVDFEIQRIKFSKIFYSSDFFFIKVEAVRKMTIKLNQQSKIDSALLDIYVKFIPFKSNPRIYSIKKHENNLSQFKTVTVITADKNESLNNDVVMFESPIPDIKPGQFYLTTNPEGATVEFIDYPDFGKKTTPTTLTYPATKYNIRLTKNEYESLDAVINVGVDKSKSFILTPTFAYLNFDITPENADVLVNGEKIYFSNSNKFDSKIPKGKAIIDISAEHYYPKRLEVNTVAGKIHNVDEMLKPKTGTLTLTAENADANNAMIFIDNIKVGNIPLNKHIILEGKHTIKIEKAKLSTVIKFVDIKENAESKINISLFAAVKTAIITEPSGATIFIDNKQIGTSNLTTKLTVGTHSIKIEKDYFETKTENIIIRENDQSSKFSYSLTPLKYSIRINSKPNNASVYFEGNYKGTTPLTIETIKGFHTFRIERDNYFPRSFIKTVSTSGTSSIDKVLYPKRLLNLNFLYGLNSWGLEIGGTISYFSLGIDFFPSMKNDIYKTSTPISHDNETFDYNYNYMSTTNQKVSVKDSAGFGYAVKGGFVLLQPFMMRIHAGYGSRSFKYYNVYQATKDTSYYGNNGYATIKKDELLKGKEQKEDFYQSFILGIEIPIRKLNLGADYWFDSEKGPGIVFRLGLNLF